MNLSNINNQQIGCFLVFRHQELPIVGLGHTTMHNNGILL